MQSGANYIGIVFYPPSHRYVSPQEAIAVVERVRQVDTTRAVSVVGLFVNQPSQNINQMVRELGINIVQLHGDESPEISEMIEAPVITALRVDSANPDPAKRRFEDWKNAAKPPFAFLVDTHVDGRFGGTGEVGDWSIAAEFANQHAVFLAGGLHPENVTRAIHQVQPFAVDVSSGVETQKLKDPAKIREFIQIARPSNIHT